MPSNVLRFRPRLPEMPEPPIVGPDPRQNEFRRIIGALAAATRDQVQLVTANLETGYHASAAALGVIKSTHQETLGHFDMQHVRDRWDEELRGWLSTSLARWIQRTKQVTMKLYPNGIAVEIETQDDDGYYRYCFDILLRKGPEPEGVTPPVE